MSYPGDTGGTYESSGGRHALPEVAGQARDINDVDSEAPYRAKAQASAALVAPLSEENDHPR